MYFQVIDNQIVKQESSVPRTFRGPNGNWVSMRENAPIHELAEYGWQYAPRPTTEWYQTTSYGLSNGVVQWTVQDENLDWVKDYMYDRINHDREQALLEPVIHNDHPWDADERSRQNLTATVAGINAGIPLPDGFTWRDNNDVNVPMTGPELVVLAAAMMAHVYAAYQTSWTRKAAVDAAQTVAEVVAC